MTLRSLRRKLQKAVSVRGLWGTGRMAIRAASHRLAGLMPSRRRAIAALRREEEAFDRRLGVDTSGTIPLSNLRLDSDNWMHGVRYEPIQCFDFGPLMAELNVDCEQFVFVDLGSGKGRALLVAGALPFQRVIGVEFSEELHEIAQANVGKFKGARSKIETVCMDAVDYRLPEKPLVLFLYNPFQGQVMERVVENVRESLERQPRRIVVVYYGPDYGALWNALPELKRVKDRPALQVFDTLGTGRSA